MVCRGQANKVVLDYDIVLSIRGKICVLKLGELVRWILEEGHNSRYSIHSGVDNMYYDLIQHYFWCVMN